MTVCYKHHFLYQLSAVAKQCPVHASSLSYFPSSFVVIIIILCLHQQPGMSVIILATYAES